MRLANWVLRDIRELLESIDPAADMDEPSRPTAAAIVSLAGEQPDAEIPRHGRHRMLATVATVFAVLVAATGVLIIRSGSNSVGPPAVNSPTGTSATPNLTTTNHIP